MGKIEKLKEKARKNLRTIILPEGEDKRVCEAAHIISKEKIAKIVLLGDKNQIIQKVDANKWDYSMVEIVEAEKHPRYEEIVQMFYQLRKHKGISVDEARKLVTDNLVNFGGCMVRLGLADGFVAGSCHTTADVARASIYCFEMNRKVGVVSSTFVVEIDNCPFGEGGLFIYGDCGIIPDPTPNQLAGVAMSAGHLMRVLFDVEPKVALLSYSTKGSAQGKSIEKVVSALKMIKEADPTLKVDGELQGDAAIVPEVAKIKCKDSKVAGQANVLIFPNLDAGNICYKLTQRLANARVVGPLLHGFLKPSSDLSRGCGVEEIIDAVTISAVRAQYEVR